MAVLALGSVACVTDLRSRRIPNVLTFGGSVAALVFFLVAGGPRGLGFSAFGWLVGFALLFPFFLLKGMGAGDVKLLALIGSWLGPVLVLKVALYGALAGGVLAVAVALRHGYLRQALSNLGYVLWYWKSVGPRPVPTLTLSETRGPRLAYALPIVTGMVAALWLG